LEVLGNLSWDKWPYIQIFLRLCSRGEHSDLSKDWRIEKNMEQIAAKYNDVNGHIHPPLFNMISIDHIVFDELYVFL
jgi:hypothetical protein